MEIDSSTQAAQKRLEEKKNQQVQEDENATVELGRKKRDHNRVVEDTQRGYEQDFVQLAKQHDAQVNNLKKLNAQTIQSLNQGQEDKILKISQDTADRIKTLSEEAAGKLHNIQLSTQEQLKAKIAKSEDPFYHMQSLNTNVEEDEKGYTIKLKIPEHEERNISTSIEGTSKVKITLTRSFQDQAQVSPQQTNQTNSFQTAVETIALGQPLNPKDMTRTYTDGVLKIRIGKA